MCGMPVRKNQKTNLFERIREYNRLFEEMSEIENSSEYAIPDQFEINDEYAGLCVQMMDIQDTINEMLIDSKYAPLVMSTDRESRDLNFFIKSSDLSFDQNIEKHLEFRLLILKEEMKKRLKSVKILRVSGDINPRVRFLYDEAVRCFIYGAFDASCVLCRAISEFVLKEFIIKKEYGHLLKEGKRDDLNKMEPLPIVKKYKLLSNEMIDISYQIKDRANKILHEKDSKTEEEHAIESIELLQNFLKGFPK